MTQEREAVTSREALLEQLANIRDRAGLEILIDDNASLVSADVVTELAKKVVERVRADIHQARALAEAAILIAEKLGTDEEIALGFRAKANALYSSGEHKEAVKHHDKAFQLYSKHKNWKEAARTLSSSIQPLILMGEYDRAFEAAEQAKQIFTELKDPWRIARLEINLGNIFHRQDRFEEAIAHYEHAYQGMLEYRDTEGIAVVLTNMAVCLISLNDFPRALASYEQAREVCEKFGMPLLVAQADYNIAYLYYLRGEYDSAIERLYAARRACEAIGDAYHYALCHLDLSDVYLELNLSDEARNMAHDGYLQFEEQGMKYEAAKTLANEAMAYGQQGKTVQALELFAKAREMFVKESNLVWPWLIDLYQALLLFHEGRHFEARRLAVAAANFFDKTSLRSKAVMAHVLLGRIALQLNELKEAESQSNTALASTAGPHTPVLDYQVYFLLGQIAQNKGDLKGALEAFLKAKQALESLRSRIHAEELKISFGHNRLQVYEALTDIFLAGAAGERSMAEALACIEAAKSRSMSEMIFRSGQSLPMGDAGQSELVRRIRDLREDLNWYYHRIELEQLSSGNNAEDRIAQLQVQARDRENELMRTLRELPANERENATLEAPADFSAADMQASLPQDSVMIEYFVSGDKLLAAVITRDKIDVVPVSVNSRAQNMLQLLRFQLSKFNMGVMYTKRFLGPMLRATDAHLEALYQELLAPIERLFSGSKSLVFVPTAPCISCHFMLCALRPNISVMTSAFLTRLALRSSLFAKKSMPHQFRIPLFWVSPTRMLRKLRAKFELSQNYCRMRSCYLARTQLMGHFVIAGPPLVSST